MTYAEVENGVRTLIRDAEEAYRFSPAEVYGYTNAGQRTLFKVRPASFFVNGRMPTTEAAMAPLAVSAVEAASGAVALPGLSGDRYLEAMIYYVAARCLERDDADTNNAALSAAYMQKFADLAGA